MRCGRQNWVGPSFAIIGPFYWYDHEIKEVEGFPIAVPLCAFSSFLDVGKSWKQQQFQDLAP